MIKGEALDCYDKFFASALNALIVRLPEDKLIINKAIEEADEIAHRMVITRYKRIDKSMATGEPINYAYK